MRSGQQTVFDWTPPTNAATTPRPNTSFVSAQLPSMFPKCVGQQANARIVSFIPYLANTRQ